MKNRKANLVTLCLIALGVLSLAGGPARANAQQHPHYLHAIADLHAAHAQLVAPFQNPAHIQAAREVMDEIDHAINDLKFAAKADGKSGEIPAPPVDPSLPPMARLQACLDYLDKAHADVGGIERDPAAMNSQAAATQRIDRSRNVLKYAMTGH
jgi:hypothetical protein